MKTTTLTFTNNDLNFLRNTLSHHIQDADAYIREYATSESPRADLQSVFEESNLHLKKICNQLFNTPDYKHVFDMPLDEDFAMYAV